MDTESSSNQINLTLPEDVSENTLLHRESSSGAPVWGEFPDSSHDGALNSIPASRTGAYAEFFGFPPNRTPDPSFRGTAMTIESAPTRPHHQGSRHMHEIIDR